MSTPSPGFRRLAGVTVAATFALIVLGGVVRLSDSGLGCGPAGSGFHSWPLCNGDLLPGLNLHAVIEFAHRFVAIVFGGLVIALAALAWTRYRRHRGLVAATAIALPLTLVQGLIGRYTVEHNLAEGLVAVHLGTAMVLLAVTIYIRRAAAPGVAGAAAPAGGRGLRRLAVAASAAVLATIVAGGYMAATEGHGRANPGGQPAAAAPSHAAGAVHAATGHGHGAHHACGTEFPTCNGGFMPFGQDRLVDIHLTHRAFMYLASILVIALAVVAIRRRPSAGVRRAAHAAAGLLVVQILLGAANVWIRDEYELLILAHLMVGTLLWASVVGVAMQLFRVPAPAGAPEGAAAGARPRGREAVTA